MLSLIRPKAALAIIATVFLLIFTSIVTIRVYFFESSFWVTLLTGFTATLTITLILMSIPKLYSTLTRLYNKFFFPPLLDLNGQWDVVIKSNWPRIQALSKSGHTPETTPDLLKIYGTLNLQCNFYRTLGSLALKDSATQRRSKTIRSDLIASSLREENGYFIFSYIAKAVVSDPTPETDESGYLVAAEIHFNHHDLTSGTGIYWTNRKYTTGHNAAGEITLARSQAG